MSLFVTLNEKRTTSLLMLVVIAVGVYVRLDQFLIQTLIDDEWHAVHQLLQSTPAKIASSFGHADYSIPLTLMYWLEAELFGLSELLMRWPMMLFGLVTLIVFPAYVYQTFSRQEAVVFGFLLALSPLLTIYSRTARPYAITLFLIYLALWAFYQCFERTDLVLAGSTKLEKHQSKRFGYGVMYCLSTAFAVWLHLIVIFFVFSPFAVELVRLLFADSADRKIRFWRLVAIGVPALALTSVLILPPLLHSFQAISVKAGADLPSIDTLTGAVYLWFGTKSGLVLLGSVVLATIGLPRIIKQSPIFTSILLGAVFTVIAILLTQPAWIQHALTLARYLLAIIPLLLLSVASGLFIVQQTLMQQCSRKLGCQVYGIMVFIVMLGVVEASPLAELLRQPNKNTTHSGFSFEFRAEKNKIARYLETRSYSKFWNTIAAKPALSQTIAVAPFYFESFHWDAPVWEKMTRQYIVPGYLLGLCVQERVGEVPDNQRFRFQNVSYLAKPDDLQNRGIDFIVYQKENRLHIKHPYSNVTGCDIALQKIYGKPIFEDHIIKVFKPLERKSTS